MDEITDFARGAGQGTLSLTVELPEGYPADLLRPDTVVVKVDTGGTPVDADYDVRIDPEDDESWLADTCPDGPVLVIEIDRSSLNLSAGTSATVALEMPSPETTVKKAYIAGDLSDAQLEARLEDAVTLGEPSPSGVVATVSVEGYDA